MLTLRAVYSSQVIVEQKFAYDSFDEPMNNLFANFVSMVTNNAIYLDDVLVRVEWLDESGEVLFKGK